MARATYTCHKELKGGRLFEGDHVILNGVTHRVHPRYLGCLDRRNVWIFHELGLDAKEFCGRYYAGMPPWAGAVGDWPEQHFSDMGELTLLVLSLFELIEGPVEPMDQVAAWIEKVRS